MNIHEEKQLKSVNDRLLWKKMLRYSVPYWRSMLGSFIMSLLIVGATVSQPMLVKSAIDDHINGLTKPMVYTSDAETADRLRSDERVIGKPVSFAGSTYFRVEDSGSGWPDQVNTARVEERDGAYYLSNASGQAPLTKEQTDAFRHQDINGFFVIGILFLLTVVLAGLFTYWQSVVLANVGQRIISDIRSRMFEHLTRLQTGFYDRNPVGRIVTRVAHDVEALNQLYSQVIVNLVKEVMLMIGIAAIMLHLHVELAFVSFAIIPLLAVVSIYFKGIIRDAQRRTRLMLSRLNSFLAESLSGMGIVQIFTRERKQLEQFNALNDAYYQAGMRGTINNSIFNPTVGLFGNLALALLVWYGGHSVLTAGVTFGVVYAFTTYIRQFFQPLTALSDRYTQIQTALASAERIFELLEEKPTISNRSDARKPAESLKGSIAFDRVWFAYESEEWVLKEISFNALPGQTVAFVGATGAGKSSIIQLINRFYDVQKGSIRIDGHDVRDLDLAYLRRSVGVIQQEPFVFTGDVYDNIRMNRADVSNEEIELAARALKMDGFIQRLPQQYRTPLGEQGIKLSSGQQQLLAFLRAFVSNPDILILDEATAHVDTETEQTIQTGLQQLSSGRTTLIVAHRLSTIRHADQIIVMHKGRIQEMGNHEELMRRNGAYKLLYDLQSGGKEEGDLSAAR